MNAARLVAVALVVAVPGTSRADDESPAAAPSGFEAPFQLVVNSVSKGDVNVVLVEDDVLIAVEDLTAAGVAVRGGKIVDHDGRPLISLRSLSPPLRYEVDEREIAVRVFAPADMLPLTVLDMRAPPPGITYTDDASGFLNYGLSLDDRGHVALYEETGLSLGAALLQSAATFTGDRPPVRGLSRLSIDDRENLTRTSFGDEIINSGPLGAGVLLGGATVSRSYELDPYALKIPGLGYSGSTVTPATLEVYLNGSRVHTEEIPPGTFELQNFYPRSGTGSATYVIRDAFGNEQSFTQPFYASGAGLRRGAHEYTYGMGVVRRNVATESFSYGRPVAIGMHRVGVDDSITAGGRIELAEARASAGPSMTLVIPVGQFGFDAAASMDPAGAGWAAQLAYSYNSRNFTTNVYGRATADEYSTLDLAPKDDRPNVDVGLGLAVPVRKVATFSYGTSVARFRDRGLQAQIDARISMELLPGLSWTLGASHVARLPGGTEWAVSTMLGYGLSGGHRASLTGQAGSEPPSAQLELSKSITESEDYGYRAQAVLEDPLSAKVLAQYQARAGRYSLRYELGERKLITAEAAGALVAVPGVGIFPTLPVQNAYGVIRLKGVSQVRGFGNGQDVGYTDRNGNLIVPNLLAYYGNRMSVESEDIPVEYELRSTEVLLGPPPRGVAIADFVVFQPHYYRGTLKVDVGGERLAPARGVLQVLDVEPQVISPIGELGEFELEGVDMGRHRLRIDFEGGLCDFELDVPEGEGPVIELGEILCVQPPTAVGPTP